MERRLFAHQHGDAQIEVAVSLPVHCDAFVDVDQEEFFGQRVAASFGTQALPSGVVHDAQVA
jgi:hypothetical protein